MDEKRLLHACELVNEGKYAEAYSEFIQLAESTPDPLERATPLIYAANTLQTMGQEEAATAQLSAVRALIDKHRPSDAIKNKSLGGAEFFFVLKNAPFFWRRGGVL